MADVNSEAARALVRHWRHTARMIEQANICADCPLGGVPEAIRKCAKELQEVLNGMAGQGPNAHGDKVSTMATVTVDEDVLIDAIEAEVTEFFQWTPVEGLAQMEASSLARSVLRRLKGLSGSCVDHTQVLRSTPTPEDPA